MSPWEHAITLLATAMTGPIARGLTLIAIVIGGVVYMYGEGHAHRTLAGIIFGGAMALAAAQFLSWLFV